MNPTSKTNGSGSQSQGWARASQIGAVALLSVTVFVAAYPRLSPGVCFEDSGDLQLAAATLGIMHPPGYPIYASIAWPATLFYGSNPARAVTIFCLLVGCFVLSLGLLIQVRLGVDAWGACAVMLIFTAHQRIWHNLVAPEVYILSLAFLAAAVFAIIGFARSGKRRHLFACGLMLGVAVVSRPPLVLSIPFFVAAWWFAERNLKNHSQKRARNLMLCVVATCLPALYAAGYLFVRDTPENPHNFVEDRRIEMGELPSVSDGMAARIERVYWEASAKLFRTYVGEKFPGVRSKARWTEREIFDSAALLGSSELPEEPIWELSLIAIAIAGTIKSFRVSAPAGFALVGLALTSLIYVLEYRVHGQAADLLPFIFVSAIVLGVATSSLHLERLGRLGKVLPIGFAVIAAGWTLQEASSRPSDVASRDATKFIDDIDVETLPKDAVIITTWGPNMPLKYATTIISPRPDIAVIPAGPHRWIPVSKKFPGRPVFLEGSHPLVERCHTIPYRSLLLLDPDSCPDQDSK